MCTIVEGGDGVFCDYTKTEDDHDDNEDDEDADIIPKYKLSRFTEDHRRYNQQLAREAANKTKLSLAVKEREHADAGDISDLTARIVQEK